MPNVFKQQWDRIPKVYKGIGAGVGTAESGSGGGDCSCR